MKLSETGEYDQNCNLNFMKDGSMIKRFNKEGKLHPEGEYDQQGLIQYS